MLRLYHRIDNFLSIFVSILWLYIHRLSHKFMIRLEASENPLIKAILGSDIKWLSRSLHYLDITGWHPSYCALMCRGWLWVCNSHHTVVSGPDC